MKKTNSEVVQAIMLPSAETSTLVTGPGCPVIPYKAVGDYVHEVILEIHLRLSQQRCGCVCVLSVATDWKARLL